MNMMETIDIQGFDFNGNAGNTDGVIACACTCVCGRVRTCVCGVCA